MMGMAEKRYRVMNHDDYELDYIADSQQGFEKVDLYDCCDLLNENEQLKQELIELKKWEKYVGDVKRKDLDKVFKMSIYEIAEAFAYYEKRIKELEE